MRAPEAQPALWEELLLPKGWPWVSQMVRHSGQLRSGRSLREQRGGTTKPTALTMQGMYSRAQATLTARRAAPSACWTKIMMTAHSVGRVLVALPAVAKIAQALADGIATAARLTSTGLSQGMQGLPWVLTGPREVMSRPCTLVH
jgi:hypothetical protein